MEGSVMLTWLEVRESMYLSEIPWESRLWFQICVIFTPTWWRFPFWRAYFSNGLVQPPLRIWWANNDFLFVCSRIICVVADPMDQVFPLRNIDVKTPRESYLHSRSWLKEWIKANDFDGKLLGLFRSVLSGVQVVMYVDGDMTWVYLHFLQIPCKETLRRPLGDQNIF